MTKGTTKAAVPAAAPAEKKKRTILTPTERIAKLKAEAQELEAREQRKAKGKLADADARVTQLTEQRDRAQAKLDDAITVRDGLRVLAGETEDTSTDES